MSFLESPVYILTILQTITTVAITVPALTPEQLPALDAWLRSILWDQKLPSRSEGSQKLEIHRLKAKLPMTNREVKIVQGVRDVFDILDAPKASEGDSLETQGKIVLIGRHIGDVPFEESFIDAINSS